MEDLNESLLGEVLPTKEDRIDMAAERAVNKARELLSRVASLSKKKPEEVADCLGVPVEEVFQVLEDFEDVSVSTLGRYLEVMGFELELSACSRSEALLPSGRRRRPSRIPRLKKEG